jgi:hypothetical protein
MASTVWCLPVCVQVPSDVKAFGQIAIFSERRVPVNHTEKHAIHVGTTCMKTCREVNLGDNVILRCPRA